MRYPPLRTRWALLAAVAAFPAAAHGQTQSTESAVESAEDAFGTATGRESIGVYGSDDVRGFSPDSAGNNRLEGLYIDMQARLSGRVIDGTTIRVGPAAQGFAFPAPTGIVDLQLRKAGDEFWMSPFLEFDSLGAVSLEIDSHIPIASGQLSLAAGLGLYSNRNANGGSSRGVSFGLVPRWRPAPGVELLAFYNRSQYFDQTAQAIYIPTGDFLPARPERARYVGPDWAVAGSRSESFGTIGRANLGDWTLRMGLFRSRGTSEGGYTQLISVAPDASTLREINASGPSGASSWSGEARISRRIADGRRQHLLTLSLRGRSVDTHYGDGDTALLGPAGLNAVIQVPKPAFAFGAMTGDFTRQGTAGLSYGLNWQGIGEFTAGVQRTHYVKRVAAPLLPVARGVSDVTLPYFTAAFTITPRLTLYGSFMRGLEDSGTAPSYASNANAVLPATRTRQYDLGLRWSPVTDTTLILGFFDISKPYISLDRTGHFGVLGQQVHRGIEFSLTSNPTKSLRIVAGGLWLDPKVQASPLIAQPVGRRPVFQPQLTTRFNINWTPPFAKALTLEGYVNHDSGSWGNVENTVYSPGSTRIGLGARYRFKLGSREFTAKVQVNNLLDAYQFLPIGSGVYVYNNPRTVQGWITTDF